MSWLECLTCGRPLQNGSRSASCVCHDVCSRVSGIVSTWAYRKPNRDSLADMDLSGVVEQEMTAARQRLASSVGHVEAQT